MQSVLLLWRGCYPVLLYALLLTGSMHAAAAGVFGSQTMNSGLLAAGAAAVVMLSCSAPLYLSEQQPVHSAGSSSGKMYRLVLLGAGFGLASTMLLPWFRIESKNWQQTAALLFTSDLRLQLLLIGVVIPAAEELVFRGLCFGRWRAELGFWPAAFSSAFLFSLFHGNIVQGFFAFGGGLLMAWGYEKFRSLKSAWIIHASANLFSLILTVYQQR